MTDLAVFVGDEQDDKEIDCAKWLNLANKVLNDQGVQSGFEVNVLFVDKVAIAALNERFMGKSGPTDVLSFPIDEAFPDVGRVPDHGGKGPGKNDDEEDPEPALLGDVILCPAIADERAPEHAGNFEDEIALLLVHGLLHLLGMDHDEEDEAEEMEARERELLGRHYGDIRAEAWNAPRRESHSPVVSIIDDEEQDDAEVSDIDDIDDTDEDDNEDNDDSQNNGG